MMDITDYNRRAWDGQVARSNRWTIPVTQDVIDAARAGDWSVVLTPTKPVPKSWFPEMRGLRVLALASGGGQQGPVFAATGAQVTVLDNSARQLEQDRTVAQRDGLQIECVQGDMRDLSCFRDGSFDLVFNPCSVLFIPDVLPVFEECFRVLSGGGTLMCGFVNPFRFVFDDQKLDSGILEVAHRLPYSDCTHLSPAELQQLHSDDEPYMFSHSLEALINGQLRAGFVLRSLFEDTASDDALSAHLPVYFATLANKA